jgi:putative phosphoribosyl transferase
MTTDEIRGAEETTVTIRLFDADLPAQLSKPENPRGMVICAAYPAAGAANPTGRFANEALHEAGFATLSVDLAPEPEPLVNPHTGEECGGVNLLQRRLVSVTDWVAMRPELNSLPLGYFAAGPEAEAAVIAAAKRPGIGAVAIFGARPGCATPFVGRVFAPCLFVVGNEDQAALDRLRSLMNEMPKTTPKQLEVLRWSTHPLKDPHGVNRVASLAREWFERYLTESPKDVVAHACAVG